MLHLSAILLALVGAGDFTESTKSARKLLSEGALEEALAAAKRAKRSVDEPKAGGPNTTAAYLLLADIEEARTRNKRAARYLRYASSAALGDTKTRKAVLRRRVRLAKKMKSPRREKIATALLGHDKAVTKLARRPKVADAGRRAADNSIDAAIRAYGKDRDASRAAWARAVRAKVRAYSDQDAAKAFDHARRVAHLTRRLPPYVRRPALEAAWFAARRTSDLEREVRYAARLDQLGSEALTPEAKRYRRGKRLEKSCARFEASSGAGSCSSVIRAATGEWVLPDFSKQRPVATLSPEQVSAANAHYLPLFQDCLRTTLEKHAGEEMFENASLSLHWIIGNDGRVMDLDLSPKRYEDVLGACIRERASWFRYGRSRGERQNVSINFELSATVMQRRRGG